MDKGAYFVWGRSVAKIMPMSSAPFFSIAKRGILLLSSNDARSCSLH
jgi:hypothetical protein